MQVGTFPSKYTREMQRYPIKHWSYSSLIAYLRNPLAWHTRYVERIYDQPTTPSAIVGRGGHTALQHFYGGLPKTAAIEIGLEYIRTIPDYEIEFGKAVSVRAKKIRRVEIEREYIQAIGFYLARPPRYRVHAIEHSATAQVPGVPLPIKAVSDLVVDAKGKSGTLAIVDHKFVDSFSPLKDDKPLFVLQAIFNYYTVRQSFNKPVSHFILQECKKRTNRDGSSQMRKYILDYSTLSDDFALFERLLADASADIKKRRHYLPNPSDMFEGKHSFEMYRLNPRE